MHVHTRYSDGLNSPEEVIREALKRGLQGVSITDHNVIEGSLEAVKIGRKLGAIVVPGVEVRSRGGDILAYGVYENIKPKLSVMETLDAIREAGGIAVAAHPYSRFVRRLSLGDLVRRYPFDGIEVFNSRARIEDNNKAAEVARELGLPGTAGSDAHSIWEVGNAYIVVEANNSEEVIKAIKRGEVQVCGVKTSYAIMALTSVRKAFLMLQSI